MTCLKSRSKGCASVESPRATPSTSAAVVLWIGPRRVGRGGPPPSRASGMMVAIDPDKGSVYDFWAFLALQLYVRMELVQLSMVDWVAFVTQTTEPPMKRQVRGHDRRLVPQGPHKALECLSRGLDLTKKRETNGGLTRDGRHSDWRWGKWLDTESGDSQTVGERLRRDRRS